VTTLDEVTNRGKASALLLIPRSYCIFSLFPCLRNDKHKLEIHVFFGCNMQLIYIYIYLHVCCKHVSLLFESSSIEKLHNIRPFLKEVDSLLFSVKY